MTEFSKKAKKIIDLAGKPAAVCWKPTPNYPRGFQVWGIIELVTMYPFRAKIKTDKGNEFYLDPLMLDFVVYWEKSDGIR